MAGLGDSPAREIWRKLRPGTFFPGRGALIEETYLGGKAEGQADYIIRALARRDISVPQEVSDRIRACADTATLNAWFDRAFAVSRAEDLFAPGEDEAEGEGEGA